MSDTILVVGNWKMNGTLQSGALQHVQEISAFMAKHTGDDVEVVLCPPAVLLYPMHEILQDSSLQLGGQDCHYEKSGAHTGDISAEMLRDTGCSYVIVGHSERRNDHDESSGLVCKKAQSAVVAGLKVIICVGETVEQRENGQAEEVVAAQLAQSLPQSVTADSFAIAYEPVWAIGTGKVASIEDISHMHEHIISLIPENLRVLYGGSVKPENAAEIMALPQVHGVLVGGASLNTTSFCDIIRAATSLAG